MYRHHHSFIPTCVLFVFALQSYIVQANIEPVTVQITSPGAALLGTEDVPFAASVTPGDTEDYNYQWYVGVQPAGDNQASFSYDVPTADADAKKVKIKCAATDKDDSNLHGEKEIDFWQFMVTVNAIAFNYDTSANLNDALNIRQNFSTAINVPEYVSGGANKPAAYTRNMTPRVCARFTVQPTDMTSLKLKATSSGCLGNLDETQVQFQNGISQGDVTIAGADYTKFTASKDTPDEVYKDTFSWEWKVTAANGKSINTASFGTTAGHTVYIVYDKAKSPWVTGVSQHCPWADVLDYACDWAAGCDDANSIVHSITQKPYSDREFDRRYDPSDTHTILACNLTQLLADSWADCRDMAAVVQLFTRAIGVNAVRIRRVEGGVDGFTTKPILPIGESQWRTAVFFMHDFAYYNDSLVYDACLTLNQNAPYIPAGKTLADYKTDLYECNGWSLLNSFEITEFQ